MFLLLSVYGIDAKPYQPREVGVPISKRKVTWESSTLRAWLNEKFWYGAFQKQERAMIAPVKLSDAESAEDKVFCLSYWQAHAYIGQTGRGPRKSVPLTELADTAIRAAHSMEIRNCWRWDRGWWLRTPSVSYPDDHAMLFYFTSLLQGGDKVNEGANVVRPAIWVSLKSR